MKTERFPVKHRTRSPRRISTTLPGTQYSYLEIRHVLRIRDERGMMPIGFGLAAPVRPQRDQVGAIAMSMLPIAGPLLAALAYSKSADVKRVLVLTPTRLHLLPIAPAPLTLIDATESHDLRDLHVALEPAKGWQGTGDPGRKSVFVVTPIAAVPAEPAGDRPVRRLRLRGIEKPTGSMRFTLPHAQSPAAAALREGLAAIAEVDTDSAHDAADPYP